MTFRKLSTNYLEPGSMWLMVLGIVALCQPWSLLLHTYGVTITLVGLVGFSIFSKVKPQIDDDAGGDESDNDRQWRARRR